MSNFDSDFGSGSSSDSGSAEAGVEKTSLRARLLAEADVLTITPPPTLPVRAAGTRQLRRRRALQAASGAIAVCAVAGAVVAWAPRDGTARPTPTPVGPGAVSRTVGSPQDVGRSSASPTPQSSTSGGRSPWPTDVEKDLPGYLRTKDLGTGWVGPYAIAEQNVSPTITRLLTCAGSEGKFVSGLPTRPPVFRIYNRTDYSTALVEAVYQYPPGQAAYAMSVIRGTTKDCTSFGGIVEGTHPVGDDSIVIGRSPNASNANGWLILVRSGDKIAFVSTAAPASAADFGAWRDTTEAEVAARLTSR